MSYTASSIPQLPTEILEHIIDLVKELMYEEQDFEGHALYPILKACALACKSMTPRSQYWLFHRINLFQQHQAEKLMQVLRRNPKIGSYTSVLTIWGASDRHTQDTAWISWIPLLLGPRLVNLEELDLYYDIFTKTHPSLPMAFTAFKSIRRLDLYKIQASNFGRCAHLIRAYPRLDHLGFEHLTWKKKPFNRALSKTKTFRTRQVRITHLDLFRDESDGWDLDEFVQWFAQAQGSTPLRTLSLYAGSGMAEVLPSVLLCAPHVVSTFLLLDNDIALQGLEHCTHLQILHVWAKSNGNDFPIKSVLAAVSSTTSRHFQELFVYVPFVIQGEKDEDDVTSIVDDFKKLDDALCGPNLKDLELRLCLFDPHPGSISVSLWHKKLPILLPKFSTMGRAKIEIIHTSFPMRRWIDVRDEL